MTVQEAFEKAERMCIEEAEALPHSDSYWTDKDHDKVSLARACLMAVAWRIKAIKLEN